MNCFVTMPKTIRLSCLIAALLALPCPAATPGKKAASKAPESGAGKAPAVLPVDTLPTVPSRVDLATVLRLAGARNLDIRIAQERTIEAEAQAAAAAQALFPTLSTGVGYSRHEGNIQDVAGAIIDADKASFTGGANLSAQLQIGEALYRKLAARQSASSIRAAQDAQTGDSVLRAGIAYFDLARAEAARDVARESTSIAEDYRKQIEQAVSAGLAPMGETHRANMQVERNALVVAQAEGQSRSAAAYLAAVLALDPTVRLSPASKTFAPVDLTPAKVTLDTLVADAMRDRPELVQWNARLATAKTERKAAVYGPLFPTVQAQAGYGGVGGGPLDSPGRSFDEATQYSAGLTWKIGPGGLFDKPRQDTAEARMRAAELELERVRLEITRQVVDAHARTQSLSVQLGHARRLLDSAAKALKLARERQAFGVSEVLENIQAEQDLTRSRLEYVGLVADYNKAQLSLQYARGGFAPNPNDAKMSR